MTNTFRALCAELIDELDYQTCNHEADDLIAYARAALAEPEPVKDRLAAADAAIEASMERIRAIAAPVRAALAAEPEGPSDDELLKLTENISTEYLCKHKSLPSDWDPGDYASSTKGLIEFARAVLARWGNQS